MIKEVSTRRRAVARCSSRRVQAGFTLVELLVVIGLILFLIAMLLPAARRSVEAGHQVLCMDHLRQISQATLMYCHDNDGLFPSGAQVNRTPVFSDWIYWQPGQAAPFDDTKNSAVGRYLGQTAAAVFRCPSDDWGSHPTPSYGQYPYRFSYSMNARIGWNDSFLTWNNVQTFRWFRLQEIRNPSEKILFADEDPSSIDDGLWLPPYGGQVWNEISGVHDVFRAKDDGAGRGNVAFCDGHAEFISRSYSWLSEHFDPQQ